MRVGTHATVGFGREFRKIRAELAGLVQKLLGLVTFHPTLKDFDMSWLVHVAHRHLVGAKAPLSLFSVDDFGSGPTLRCAQHDHWPAWALLEPIAPRVQLNVFDF